MTANTTAIPSKTVMTTAMMITGTSTASKFDPMKSMYLSFTDVCETVAAAFADLVPMVPMVPTDIGTGVATAAAVVVPELAHTFDDIEPEELRNISFFWRENEPKMCHTVSD